MNDVAVAKRYAVAIFMLAKEKHMIDQLGSEFLVLKEIFASEEIVTVFNSPKVSADKKKKLVAEAFASFSIEMRNTLNVLIEKHREDLVLTITSDFLDLVNEENGVADAIVTSVAPITETEINEISTVFSKKIGKKALRITNVTDPSVIGGASIRIGNQVFDGTIGGKLNRLERHLLG